MAKSDFFVTMHLCVLQFDRGLILFCVSDAQLLRIYVPWLRLGKGIQHEPHYSQTLVGKRKILSQLFDPVTILVMAMNVNLQACKCKDSIMSLRLHFPSLLFKRITVAIRSITSAIASVWARWCMAWFTCATFRWEPSWLLKAWQLPCDTST